MVAAGGVQELGALNEDHSILWYILRVPMFMETTQS